MTTKADDTFLTEAELARLTGRKQKHLQIDVLSKRGVPFWPDAFGRPVVPRTAIEGGRIKSSKPEVQWTPPPAAR